MKMRLSKLLLASAFVFAAASSQASAAGKSLKETLTFIRDSLAFEGKITYVVAVHNAADGSDFQQTMTSEASKVAVDAGNCSLSLHWQTTVDGGSPVDIDRTIFFAQGTTVGVMSREEEVRTQLINAGRPNESGVVTPQVWVVSVVTGGTADVLNFTNQLKAERVSRAMRHAMDLCGASDF